MTNVYHEKYGFKPEDTLPQLPLKGKENGFSDILLNSLKKGNLTPVTFIKDGEEFKPFLAANPQYKNIDVFDENGKHIFHTKMQQQNAQKANKQKAETPPKATVKKTTANGKKKAASTKAKKSRSRVAEPASGKSMKK